MHIGTVNIRLKFS